MDAQRSFASAWTRYAATTLDLHLRERQGGAPQERALALFRDVATSVPAYRSLLREHAIDPASVRSPADFERLPILTKDSYQRKFPLPELCRGGSLETCDLYAVSSGSTGAPTFWPRSLADELEIAWRFEQVFHDSFRADERRTLAVVCFALGTWVGGLFTTNCCRYLAAKGYPVSVVAPGSNRDEIWRVVRELGPLYEQTVLLGYPPFLKEVVDGGPAHGIDWSPLNVKLVLAGEVFSEEWRTLVGERTGSRDPLGDFASIYGTADAGVLANETPLSVCIRRMLAERPEAARQLFREPRLPTLAQYDPLSRYFEVQEGRLLFTGDNGVPLIRYNILDAGGLTGCREMLRFLADFGLDPLEELSARGHDRVRDLPFVWVFGRSHFAVSYYGANVYPENVMVGLEQPEVRDWVTGKFVLEAKEDADRNASLSLTVELAPGVEGDYAKRDAIGLSVVRHLVRLNSEFAHYVPAERQRPHVALRPPGDAEYFPAGVKHRYTR